MHGLKKFKCMVCNRLLAGSGDQASFRAGATGFAKLLRRAFQELKRPFLAARCRLVSRRKVYTLRRIFSWEGDDQCNSHPQ